MTLTLYCFLERLHTSKGPFLNKNLQFFFLRSGMKFQLPLIYTLFFAVSCNLLISSKSTIHPRGLCCICYHHVCLHHQILLIYMCQYQDLVRLRERERETSFGNLKFFNWECVSNGRRTHVFILHPLLSLSMGRKKGHD